MKVVVFGSGGQLGRELARASWPRDTEVTLLSRQQLDLCDEGGVERFIERARPKLAINASAYTAVDAAESDPGAAFATNRDAVAALARTCAGHGLALIHVSTDYVFDGLKASPYTEQDVPAPLGVYGQSKLEGEQAVRSALAAHLIVRTSWVYSAFGSNFVSAILRLAKERDTLRIVNDQVGRPTSAADLARALVQLASRCNHATREEVAPWGTYHYAGAGSVSRFDFAAHLVALQAAVTGRSPTLEAIPSSEYPTPARRPLNSVLDTARIERAFGLTPEPWQIGAEKAVRELMAIR